MNEYSGKFRKKDIPYKFEDILKDALDCIEIKQLQTEDIIGFKSPLVITFNQRPNKKQEE